jgi:sensor histidine kinase regulating citrate/malate metabolism
MHAGPIVPAGHSFPKERTRRQTYMKPEWFRDIDAGIVVCDAAGVILSMNESAVRMFRKSGGRDLIGRNILECHPDRTIKQVEELLEKKESYCYMVDIKGSRSMLFLNPWYENEVYGGFVEFIFSLPGDVPVRREMQWVKR